MENKELYYTPKIEDFKVGYTYQEFIDGEETRSYTFTEADLFGEVKVCEDHKLINSKKATIKVKYLDREDIESCGWIPFATGGLESGCMNGRCAFTKGNYILVIASQPNTKLGNRIEIAMKDVLKDDYIEWTSNGRMYIGECKSINEFKYITEELLNIQ